MARHVLNSWMVLPHEAIQVGLGERFRQSVAAAVAIQRATTKERDLKKAKTGARDLLLTAEIRKRDNLPVITRKFRHVAKLAKKRMTQDTAAGSYKVFAGRPKRLRNAGRATRALANAIMS